MSCYEWESGTIKLPTAGFTPFRKALEIHTKDRMEKAFARTQEFWQTLTPAQKRDIAKYRAAVSSYVAAQWRTDTGRRDTNYANQLLAEDVQGLLEQVARPTYAAHGKTADGKARRVLRTDVNFPTNKTRTFSEDELSITFNRDRSEVTWSIQENNHAVDSAEATQLAAVFFAALAKVRFTRNTGGVVVGNNEYNGDDREVGSGGNYVAWTVGPIGQKKEPSTFRPYRDGKGVLVSPARSHGNHGLLRGPSFGGRW